MSDTQSPVSDRTSSILNRDLPPDKKPKGDKPTLPSAREFDSTGLVQRCVIIQRDENGFGLTVSGDNPVFVQLVKEGGAAMRAGVQAGDRIIKVNGTLVTQSNHGEVVKLIRSGSYVALTVLGRPPGSAQIPLSEVDMNLGSVEGHGSSLVTPPRVPKLRADDWEYKSRTEAWENSADAPQTMLVQEWQDLQDGVCVRASEADATRITTETFWSFVQRASGPGSPDDLNQRDSASLRMSNLTSCPSPKTEDTAPLTSDCDPCTGTMQAAPIIAADNDCFDSEQEQSCFQSVELLKCRPAHLAAFLHHVVSQCDPAPMLCYLYAELYKHANPKVGRRVFMDFLSFFVDRGANLKVAVPESISSDLECRRPELIPEDLHRQYIQTMQDTLLPDVQRLLEDFRQKHSMGLSVADDDLSQLDGRGDRHARSPEQERACAESILSKMIDVLTPLQATDEDRCMNAQYVILSYMKFLGVRYREAKRTRITFLPKIKKSIKVEKEGEEKVKKPRFCILGPPRRPSRPDAASGRVADASKPRHQKPLPQSLGSGSEGVDSGCVRGPQLSEGSDLALSPTCSSTYSPSGDTAVRDPECGGSPSPSLQRSSDGGPAGDMMEYPPCDYLPYSLEHLDEERDVDRLDEVLSEDDGCGGGALYSDADPPSWQQLVGQEVLAGLTPHEIKRQEVINELFYTEHAHIRMLKVLNTVFYQKLARDNILPSTDIRNIFANLEEIVHLHVTISEQMAAIRRRNELSVVDQIGDSLLSWFGGAEEERMKRAVGAFCSNQPFALELIKHRQKKDQRFLTFMQEAESNRLCRRLQLKDIIPAEMQRLTKYPLLLENVAKYTGDPTEKDKVKKAADCCRKILNHVNQAVKEAENKQRLEHYQRRLDLSSLKQSENPLISELKSLDLTKRKLVHEGPLTWKLNKDKTVELYSLLLEDVLVLLQKQDDRLILKCHSKNRAGTADSQHTFSPVVKLNTVLVRSVATDNRSFFVLSMSDNGAQIYELMAQTVSEQRLWQRHISQCAEMMKATPHGLIASPQGSGEKEGVSSASGKGSTGLSPVSCCSSGPAPSPAPSPKEVERAHKVVQDYSSSCLDSELLDGRDTDLLNSECRAEEALKTLAVLKQVLVTQLMAQDSDEQFPRPASGRLLRTSSLRSPVQHGSQHSPCRARDATAGDTGFYEGPEDCAGYLVLEGCGESSTDDGVRCGRGTLGLAHSCAADSGISLRFPSASAQSVGLFSHQVLAHLRDLQADLKHLKGMESRYYSLIRQRHGENGDSKDKN